LPNQNTAELQVKNGKFVTLVVCLLMNQKPPHRGGF